MRQSPSCVGQGMVEAFARYVQGRAHIIIVLGRNEHAAADIFARLPNPDGAYGWKHEFTPWDPATAKAKRVNFLLNTTGYTSMAAHVLSENSKVICVLGVGRGSPKRPIDLDNLGNTVKPRVGDFKVALRSIIASSGYTDTMLTHSAAQNPGIAFTHIHPNDGCRLWWAPHTGVRAH
ncbi:hypothetical protein C8F04DRAFT_1304905 [Mycena alexandri]|uniref:Uncharacterized protein n=1 Tax=Mycena alexandri TaxID=1745969 RepID=A0AAD6SAQ6_9AGAR|nr:hypothetical protein C8F04DRAFT_1304905 [Mycena alexandri]